MKKKILIGGISAVLVSFISLLVLSTHSVNAAEADEKYIAAKSGLNLRSDPNKSSKVCDSDSVRRESYNREI